MTITYKTGAFFADSTQFTPWIALNDSYSFQIDGTSLDASDATVEIQITNDTTSGRFNVLPGTTATLIGPDPTQVWDIRKTAVHWARLAYLPNSVTTGNLRWIFEGS